MVTVLPLPSYSVSREYSGNTNETNRIVRLKRRFELKSPFYTHNRQTLAYVAFCNLKKKVVPLPKVLLTSSKEPLISMSFLQMASPSPAFIPLSF